MGACAAASLAADEMEVDFRALSSWEARVVAHEDPETTRLLDALWAAHCLGEETFSEKDFVALHLATRFCFTDLSGQRQLDFAEDRREAQRAFRRFSDGGRAKKQSFTQWQRRYYDELPATRDDREATNMVLEHNCEVCQCSAQLLREVFGPQPWDLDADLPRGWRELAQELKKVPGKDDTAPDAAWGSLQEEDAAQPLQDVKDVHSKSVNVPVSQNMTALEDVLKLGGYDFYGFMTTLSGPAESSYFHGQPYSFEVPGWMDTWTCGFGGASGLLPQGFAASPGTVILVVVSDRPTIVPELMQEALKKLKGWAKDRGTTLRRKAWHRHGQRLPPKAQEQLLTFIRKAGPESGRCASNRPQELARQVEAESSQLKATFQQVQGEADKAASLQEKQRAEISVLRRQLDGLPEEGIGRMDAASESLQAMQAGYEKAPRFVRVEQADHEKVATTPSKASSSAAMERTRSRGRPAGEGVTQLKKFLQNYKPHEVISFRKACEISGCPRTEPSRRMWRQLVAEQGDLGLAAGVTLQDEGSPAPVRRLPSRSP